MIRKARISDVANIHQLLSTFAKQGDLLGRSLSELYDNLRDFYVYQDGDHGPVVGSCALHICWEDLAEIRSLAVVEDFQRRGIGRSLVEACISEAITLGIYRIFTLTNRPDFFMRLGFIKIDKATLPQKIWSDCIKCYKFPQCDEVALLLQV
ncbi:MAG: N-acetyltransferase [Thermodesulfobacteriota bacterium]